LFKDYYQLTKPGIIRGNLWNTAGGFLLASTGRIDLKLLAAALAGTALVIACACVLNNIIDRRIDSKMKRTQNRALASGKISVKEALVYGVDLGILGFLALAVYTNGLTVAIGALSLFLYVAVYGYFKRRTTYGTLVGSIPGALPPVAGYTAVTGHIDTAAWLVFFILVAWQMAHFYAIGIYHQAEYKAAGLPIKPVVQGAAKTKPSIIAYIATFTIACALLTLEGYTHFVFLIVMTGFGLTWLWLGLKDYKSADPVKWGKKMFLFSLTVILALAVMLAVGARLP
jgi:protoheme IX farnesyltransferase